MKTLRCTAPVGRVPQPLAPRHRAHTPRRARASRALWLHLHLQPLRYRVDLRTRRSWRRTCLPPLGRRGALPKREGEGGGAFVARGVRRATRDPPPTAIIDKSQPGATFVPPVSRVRGARRRSRPPSRPSMRPAPAAGGQRRARGIRIAAGGAGSDGGGDAAPERPASGAGGCSPPPPSLLLPLPMSLLYTHSLIQRGQGADLGEQRGDAVGRPWSHSRRGAPERQGRGGGGGGRCGARGARGGALLERVAERGAAAR